MDNPSHWLVLLIFFKMVIAPPTRYNIYIYIYIYIYICIHADTYKVEGGSVISTVIRWERQCFPHGAHMRGLERGRSHPFPRDPQEVDRRKKAHQAAAGDQKRHCYCWGRGRAQWSDLCRIYAGYFLWDIHEYVYIYIYIYLRGA